MALLLAWLWQQLLHLLAWPPLWPSLGMIVLVLAFGLVTSNIICKKLHSHDHGAVVVDEFIGQWLVLLVVPLSITGWLAGGIPAVSPVQYHKPWPISTADRHIHGGIGVMLDDVLAAGYAILVLYCYWLSCLLNEK